MGRACVAAGVRRPIMRESWSSASYPFVRARRPVVYWRRRLTFLKAGRGHTTSSSSAIAIAKNGPAKLFNHLSATKLRRRAPPVLREQEGLDKDGKWLVPYRTLALDL